MSIVEDRLSQIASERRAWVDGYRAGKFWGLLYGLLLGAAFALFFAWWKGLA